MITGKPGMQNSHSDEGEGGERILRERKLMGLPVTPSVFLLLFWGACQKVADSKIPSLP